MIGRIAAMYRHPVKGFTPEEIGFARLGTGRAFPGDRLYAVENGPCGYDPAAPAFVPKQKFAVLAVTPEVAQVRTRYDDAQGRLHAEAPGMAPFEGELGRAAGRDAFAAWLTDRLGGRVNGPLKVIAAAEGLPFTDHPQGHVSIVNLASVRDLEARLGRTVNPLRFRANLYVEGWPAWAETGWDGRRLQVGTTEAKVLKSIVRCAATHVDPDQGVRDIELVKALFDNYGHMHCGIYVNVTRDGEVRPEAECALVEEAA